MNHMWLSAIWLVLGIWAILTERVTDALICFVLSGQAFDRMD